MCCTQTPTARIVTGVQQLGKHLYLSSLVIWTLVWCSGCEKSNIYLVKTAKFWLILANFASRGSAPHPAGAHAPNPCLQSLLTP